MLPIKLSCYSNDNNDFLLPGSVSKHFHCAIPYLCQPLPSSLNRRKL